MADSKWGKQKVFLVLNSGSSSERFSLFVDGAETCSLYYEGVEASDGVKRFICTITRPNGFQKQVNKTWNNLDESFNETKALLEAGGVLVELDAILVRVVAAGQYFAEHHVVDAQTLTELERVTKTNPLHAPRALNDIQKARAAFPNTPIVIMSDSAMLMQKSRRDLFYALPEDLTNELELKRWGAHGASYGYIIDKLRDLGLIQPKMIVCHLGSGSSVSAFINGEPVYTSMGETPLEGLVSSTRAGNIDPTIGVLVGEKLGGIEAIKLFNQRSGLLALTGSNDMRQVIDLNAQNDIRGKLGFEMFADGVAGKIGEYAAKMGGVDGVVFTATIGERSDPVRQAVISKLGFMGFQINTDGSAESRMTAVAEIVKRDGYANIATDGSKPVYVMATDEASWMVKEAGAIVEKLL